MQVLPLTAILLVQVPPPFLTALPLVRAPPFHFCTSCESHTPHLHGAHLQRVKEQFVVCSLVFLASPLAGLAGLLLLLDQCLECRATMGICGSCT